MTLASDGTAASSAGRVAAAVYLDIPVRTLIAEVRKLFPEKTRVGVILNPGRGGDKPSQIRSQAPEPVSAPNRRVRHGGRIITGFSGISQEGGFSHLPAGWVPV